MGAAGVPTVPYVWGEDTVFMLTPCSTSTFLDGILPVTTMTTQPSTTFLILLALLGNSLVAHAFVVGGYYHPQSSWIPPPPFSTALFVEGTRKKRVHHPCQSLPVHESVGTMPMSLMDKCALGVFEKPTRLETGTE